MPVEHIGSTSVPGLAAKPSLDIMAGVHDLYSARDAFPVLASHGHMHSQHRPATLLPRPLTLLHAFIAEVGWRVVPPASVESELGRENSSPRARPPDYDDSSARRDHQASAAVIALSAWRMPSPTSPAVAAQCKGIRARAPGSQRCSSGVSGSGAVPS